MGVSVGSKAGVSDVKMPSMYICLPLSVLIWAFEFMFLHAIYADMLKRILAVLVFFIVFEDFLRNFEVFFDCNYLYL